MQNDMLKNTIAPWQEKGRWYHALVESDGTQWKIITEHSDNIFTAISSNRYLNIGDISIIPIKAFFKIYNNATVSFTVDTDAGIRYGTGGKYVLLPNYASVIGKIDLWVFMNK